MADDFGVRRRSRHILMMIVLFMMVIMLVNGDIFLYLLIVLAIVGTITLIYYIHAMRTPYARFFGVTLNEGDIDELFKRDQD